VPRLEGERRLLRFCSRYHSDDRGKEKARDTSLLSSEKGGEEKHQDMILHQRDQRKDEAASGRLASKSEKQREHRWGKQQERSERSVYSPRGDDGPLA